MKSFLKRAKRVVRNTSLRFIFLSLVLFTVVAAGSVSVFFSGRVAFQSKLSDAQTIQYLQLERSTNLLQSRIFQFAVRLKKALSEGLTDNQSLLYSDGAHFLTKQGNMPPKIHQTYFGGILEEKTRYNFYSLAGKSYLGFEITKQCWLDLLETANQDNDVCRKAPRLINSRESSERYFVFTEISSQFFGKQKASDADAVYYLSNNFGQLVFSNSESISSGTLIERDLVQTFIQNNLRSGFKFFETREGSGFGMYRQVPNTNLVGFFEYSSNQIFSIAYKALIKVVLLVLSTMLAVGILVILTLNAFLKPLEQLHAWSMKFGAGELSLRLKPAGVGEIRKLSEQFMGMADGIQSREKSIIQLMQEQKEKVKLESELAITETIQENFLPHKKVPSTCPFQISATYIAAEKASGDWYHYNYDEDRKLTVVVVADVSGHGVGSAMYTACIAAIYREYWNESEGGFSPLKFSEKVHRVFSLMAGGKWHATMIVLSHIEGEDEVTIVNNGHVFPIVYSKDELGKTTYKRARFPSHVCGLGETFSNLENRLSFPKGSVMILYTDGIIEACNPNGRQYGIKKMMKSVKNTNMPTKEISSNILQAWYEFTQGVSQEDDICLLTLKRRT